MPRRSRPCTFVMAVCVSLVVGCDEKKTVGPPCCDDLGGPAPDFGSSPDRPVVNGDSGKPVTPCDCKLDEVCDSSGKCIPAPKPAAGEIDSELVLLRQESPLDSSILKALGKAEASFWPMEPLPADTRQTYANSDGERCTFEMGSQYPYSFNGKTWPAGPTLGAGDLTFTVAGAASTIVLEDMDVAPYGWAYYHKDLPPHLAEGAVSYPDFFDPVHLPAGAQFQLKTVGGNDIGPHTFTGGELPALFTITQPAAETTTAQAASGADLVVKWSPPQPSAYMEVFITSSAGGDVSLVSCKGRDDGTLTVPVAAMKTFLVGETLGLQLRRTTDRYTKLTTTGGKTLHVHLLGRHARLGRFTWK